MQITIIQFSPSGNTRKVTLMLKKELEARKQDVQVLDISDVAGGITKNNIREFLDCNIKPHDIPLLGGPVYAHHMQYHMLDLIAALPKPDMVWGRYAIPYVTYGGISSGVALKETAKLLKRSGRIVPAGLKVSAPHGMTKAFMPSAFNGDKLTGGDLPEITELVDRIMRLDGVTDAKCHASGFGYNGLATGLKAKVIFKEKVWHAKRYPKISIDRELCSNCGKCAGLCPVGHLEIENGLIAENHRHDCIHCFNCVTGCAAKAIKLVGDMERGRAFMQKMIAQYAGKEKPATAVYPLR